MTGVEQRVWRWSLVVAALCLGVAYGAHRLGSDSLPDFSRWPAGEARKQAFFDFMRPLLEAENARVLAQRRELETLAQQLKDGTLGWWDQRRLARLARAYGLDPQAVATDELIAELLLRADEVPVSLGLAQAAKESGWGTSRFAVDGNALFGERCFSAGCGLVPEARSPHLRHEVRAFSSPRQAVAGYVNNLNTHPDYQRLREMRSELRAAGEPLTGFELAEALSRYSERRDRYTREVRQLIRRNELGPGQAR